ncbi:MAG: disulfide bond formation protein B [Rhodospirillales bacterium]|nr:disulfide bond formation protein B [Rhodospirillales bacterium]
MTQPARLVPALIMAIGLGAIAAALVAQYVFNLQPCILCYYQRVPYVAALLLGAHALPPWTPANRRVLCVALAGLAFLANGGIALFHVGVENHWWAGTDSCGSPIAATTIEDLRRQLMAAPVVRCDEVTWSLFGISMAGYNALAAPFLAAFAFWGARAIAKTQTGSSSVSQ